MENLRYNNDPLVSVVIITYNQENSIARTIESIINQKTSFKFEIIIGDDASSDKTKDICLSYAEKHSCITYIRNIHNKGILNNYYDCLLRCRGKYIADCAGDDFWIDNQKLQKQYDILENHPDVSLVHTGWQYYDSLTQTYLDSDPLRIREKFTKPFIDKGDLLIPILRRDAPVIIHLCSALYRRDIFLKEYAKDPKLFRNPDFTCEDIQIEAIMAAEGKIAYIPDITLAYSIGHKSASSGESFQKNFNFYFGVLKLNKYIQNKYSIPTDKIQVYYNDIIPYLWSQIFYSGSQERIEEFKIFISKIKYHSTWKTLLYKFALKQKHVYRIIFKIQKYILKK